MQNTALKVINCIVPTLPSGPSHVFPHHIIPHQAEKEQQENRKHFHQRTIKVARSTVKVGILSLFHLSLPKLYCFTFSLLKEALGITLLHLLKKKKKMLAATVAGRVQPGQPLLSPCGTRYVLSKDYFSGYIL